MNIPILLCQKNNLPGNARVCHTNMSHESCLAIARFYIAIAGAATAAPRAPLSIEMVGKGSFNVKYLGSDVWTQFWL